MRHVNLSYQELGKGPMGDVPCNGCVACCKRERIILGPDDDAGQYITVPALGPGTGYKEARMLAHKENGDCIYLGDAGCTIHGHAPKVCQQFDCRDWYRAFTYPEELKPDDLDGEVIRAARARL